MPIAGALVLAAPSLLSTMTAAVVVFATMVGTMAVVVHGSFLLSRGHYQPNRSDPSIIGRLYPLPCTRRH